MKFLEEKVTGYILLISIFVIGIIIILTTNNSLGGADNYSHYQIARWSWKHYYLFFDHWGKPVYTILSSPFSQFGIDGSRFFNLITGLTTAFFIWKTTIILKIKNHIISLLLVIFTPIYFSLMFTSLTEVLFSCFLAIAVFLFFDNKYILSAIIISFVPMIRTEGVVLIPLFIIAYALKKQLISIIFVLTGFIVISTAGYFFTNDYWWLITQMPYNGDANDIYGSGSLFRFVNDMRGILGYPINVLFVIGMLILLFKWIIKEKFQLSSNFYILLIVAGSFILFFTAHSIAWWKGIGNSYGLIRVIGSVTPMTAIIALPAFNLSGVIIGKYSKKICIVMLSLLTAWIIVLGPGTHKRGFKIDNQQKEMINAVKFLSNNQLEKNKIYYFDPYITILLDIDPYDETKCNWGIGNTLKPSSSMPDNSILVWDAHFGPNEGRTPLDNITSDENIKLIKAFTPKISFKTVGNNDYSIYVFQKNDGK